MPTPKPKPATQIVTGKVRLSYVHVFEPHAFDSNPDKAQYSVCVLVKKNDQATLERISAAIEAAKADGKVKKWNNKIPLKLWNPLRDGDVERAGDETYAGCYFLNAKSGSRPAVVDTKLNPVLDKEELYSGCYARVSLSFFPYATSGSSGIGVGLNNIQKVADGEKLSGRSSADEDFEEFTEDNDDMLG
jgi:hypothetical protein